MPGLTSMEVANPDPQHNYNQPVGDSNALQLLIKDESADGDDDEFLGDELELTYKPRPQLPKPFVVMRTLAHLMRDLENGIIDVDPEYQREVVWTADRMTGLINSLMENFYIPPIILNKKTHATTNDNQSHTTLICVDGKQRLSSVRAFVKGMIPCHDHRGEKWWFCDALVNRRKRFFPEETQRHFLSKEFVSFEFTDLSPEQEEDLFARVQMGVQLSPAEKMRASTGPWQELARLFVEDFSVIYSLMKDRARAKDFQLTLSCFSQIIEVMHPAASNGIPILKTNYAALPKLLSNKGAVDDGIKSHLASVWNTFKDLIELDPDTFTNANKYLLGVQTFAPIEMVAVTVLISMYSDTRNDHLLLGDIQAMRNALRENFADLRLNPHVWKFVWGFIEDLEAVRGAVDGSTISRKQSKQPSRDVPATPSALPGQIARPPAKTKPASILPPRKKATVKREEAGPTPLSEVRSPKRQRTDLSPERAMSSSHAQKDHFASKSPFSVGHSPTTPFLPPTHAHNAPQPVVQQPSTSSLGPSSRRMRTPAQLPQPKSTISIPSNTAAFPFRPPGGTLTNNQPPDMSAERLVPLPTSDQVLQARGSELDSYRAPFAPMGASAPVAPLSRLVPTSSMGPSNSSYVAPPITSTPPIRRLGSGNLTLRTSIGAFAPSHTEQQWEGVVTSISPRMPQQMTPTVMVPVPGLSESSPASTTPLSQPRSIHRPRKRISRPTPAQLDGAVDLTSDTELEQERQDLLSSFKGQSVTSKQLKSYATPAASNAPIEQVPVAIQDIEAEQAPIGLNPYAKFKTK